MPLYSKDELGQRHDTQHNDTQHIDTQHNDTQHNDIQNNDIQNNDSQHNNKQNVIFSKTTLSMMKSIMMSVIYAHCHFY